MQQQEHNNASKAYWLSFAISRYAKSKNLTPDNVYECDEILFKELKYLKFDIVEGPVANDNIAVVLDQFMMNMKSETALVEALEYKNLNHQISFHTGKGISLLNKVRQAIKL